MPSSSECLLDIRFREIVADEEQGAGVLIGDVLGKAVAEINRRRVPLLPQRA